MFTLENLKQSISSLNDQLKYGCGNHSCKINPLKGMGTNTICRCMPKEISKILLNLALLTEEMDREWRE